MLRTTRREFLGACGAPLLAAAEFRRGGMTYRALGRTGMQVSLLAFGSHTDPADRVRAGPAKTALTPAGQERRDRLIARAFDRGVNLLDVYDTEGQWEPAARMVKPRRDRILVSLAHECTPAEIDRACHMFGHVDLYRFHTADVDGRTLETWDLLRRAREAGKIRAIGIATHIERVMLAALEQLEGLDFFYFPYNFIHARADYSQSLPAAIQSRVGLIAMKPLASGSIVKLDPRVKMQTGPEYDRIQLWRSASKPILPAAVAELTKSLDRMPGETLCMAAMRFVYSKPFVSTAIAGMFEERCLDDNHRAMASYNEKRADDRAALDAAARVASLLGPAWLPPEYRWLEEQWRA